MAPSLRALALLALAPVLAVAAPTPPPAPAPAVEPPLTPAELALSKELEETVRTGAALLTELAKPDQSLDSAVPQADKERRVKTIIARFERLLRDNPDHQETLILYGKFLRSAGEHELAFKVFLRADRNNPNLAAVKHQLGAHLAETGAYVDALPLLRRSVELAPTEPRYHYDFAEYLTACGDALILEGKMPRAERDRLMIEHFDTAAKLNPGEAGYRWRAAEARYDIRNPDAAAALAKWEALDREATTEAQHEVIGLHRARWLIAQGKITDARRFIAASRSPGLNTTRARLKDELLRYEHGLQDPAPPAAR